MAPEKQQRGINYLPLTARARLGRDGCFCWTYGTNNRSVRFQTKPRPRGHFLLVIAMLEPVDFFENQIKECNAQAAQAANKADREFWRCLADRWQQVLRAENTYSGPDLKNVHRLRPTRGRPSKRQAA